MFYLGFGGIMQDRSITLFVMESKKNLKTAELSNWNGKAYIGERSHVSLLQNIEELHSPGIYFLLEDPQENESKELNLYIGESDNVAKRLRVHTKPSENWDKFIVFIANGIDKAHVQRLESLVFELARKNSEFFNLKNDQPPNKSAKLPDSKMAEINCFLDNMVFVLNNLGLIDFAKTRQAQDSVSKNSKDIFCLHLKKENKEKKAMLAIVDDKYVLLKGSYLEKNPTSSFTKMPNWKKQNGLIEKGLLVEQDGVLYSKEDIYFKSPSGAADIVRLNSTNGRLEWKLEDGTTLADFETKNS